MIETRKRFCVMLLSAITVAFLMMVANHLVLSQIREEARRQAGIQQENSLRLFRELLRRRGTEFRLRDGLLWIGDYPVNGNNEIPDKVLEITGSRATVFMGDTRVATNVLLPDGRRALGTRLAGPAYDALYREGASYRGVAPILGIPYFTAYDPIKNSRGETIGVIFVGVKETEYLARYDRINLKIQAIISTLAAVFALLAWLLLSERKRSEDAIQKQLNFLRVLSDTIPSPIFSKDAQGRYNGCNKAFLSYVGLSREELIGKTVHELWPSELAERYRRMDLELLQNGGTQVYESQVRYADGSLHEVIYNKAPYEDQKGVPGGLVGVMLDITERKGAEEEIRNAYQRTADILEFLPDATFVVDKQKRVIAWNRAIEEMTGVGKEEMLGQGDLAYAIPFFGSRKELLIDLLDAEQEVIDRNCRDGKRKGSTLLGDIYLDRYRGGDDRIFKGDPSCCTAAVICSPGASRAGAAPAGR